MVRRLVADNIDVRAVVPAMEQGLEDMFLELTSTVDTHSKETSGRRRKGGAK